MTEEQIKKKYPEGMTILEIASEAGLTKNAVYLRANSLGVDFKNLKKESGRGSTQPIVVIRDYKILEKLARKRDSRGRGRTDYIRFYIPGWQDKTREEIIEAVRALV